MTGKAPVDTAPAPRGRRRLSPITRRTLAVNVLALVILVAGLLYLDEYRRGLIDAELAALHIQADLFAAALGEGATATDSSGEEQIVPAVAHQMIRRLVQASGARARLFAPDGSLITDSRQLIGPGGMVQIEVLPPPKRPGELLGGALGFYDRLAKHLGRGDALPMYREHAEQRAENYEEVARALGGEPAESVRAAPTGGMMLSVTAPVQRYKQVLGSLMLSRDSQGIDAAVLDVRVNILKVFVIAVGITVLLSLYLAGTIARPLTRLAAAAERVRKGHNRQHAIPDFRLRNDEIGDLALALREMTEALWQRMDAIEGFAADVAHEIKNPLTSLRSAVETAARVKDPDQQRKLMSIIQEDVQRLDRLISDISNASRLDAELSRAETEPVDVGRMLATLVDVNQAAATARDVSFNLDAALDDGLVVNGVEGRLVQVFRNLIANAVSFSPPGGTITLQAAREDSTIVATVVDQGPGIPEGKEAAIFDRFYSERPRGEKFGTHSGLGLSISKQIVEAHGGTITASNVLGADGEPGGARFEVRLSLP